MKKRITAIVLVLCLLTAGLFTGLTFSIRPLLKLLSNKIQNI